MGVSRYSVSDHMSSRTNLIPERCRNFGGDEQRSSKEAPPVMIAACSNKNEMNPNKLRNYPPKDDESSSLPDYQSEAPIHMNNVEELATSTSPYSLGDTDTYYSFERIDYESSSPTSDNEEEEQVRKPKRRRTYSEIHNLSEKKRRDKINKKMRTLQALVPNSDKADKATMLDNAIDYLKSLQLQLQLMTTIGSRVCMMLPSTGMHAANMMGMGMGLPFGVCFCPTPFPNAPMLGLNAARMLPMPAAPFFPMTTTARPPLPVPPNSLSHGSIFISRNNPQLQESIQVTRENTNH